MPDYTETTNFSLKKPNYGAAGLDWYSWVNEAFDTIDARLTKHGEEGFRRTGSSADRRYLGGMPRVNAALSTGAPTANVLRAVPFITGPKVTLDRIGINVTSAVSGNQRLGIYTDNNGYPGDLVADLGVVTTGTTGVKEITISPAQSLAANTLYWLAIVGDAAPTVRTVPVSTLLPILGLDSGYGTALGVGWSVSFTYAALPATFTAGGSAITADPVPAIGVRIA